MKYLKNTFFILFFIITGFVLGGSITAQMVSDKSGFTGSASVFWGATFGVFLGLILGVVSNQKIERPIIKNIISFLGLASVIVSIIFIKLDAGSV